jgi:uncharacterized protein
MILLLFIWVKKKGHIAHQATDKTERFFLSEKANRSLWVKALFFPLPFLFIYLIHRLSLRGMKKGPFSCYVCKAEAAAASKETVATVLGPSKAFENSIGSSDHRVYQCPAGHILEIPFPGRKAGKYSVCGSCGTRAVHQTADRTLTAATYSSTGTGQKEFTCRFCQALTQKSYTIPVKTRESSGGSGSSGGSSSSGSSSWGGGSTGGGGAGGKW